MDQSRYPEILKLLYTNFHTDEPMSKALGIIPDKDTRIDVLDDFAINGLKQVCSALLENKDDSRWPAFGRPPRGGVFRLAFCWRDTGIILSKFLIKCKSLQLLYGTRSDFDEISLGWCIKLGSYKVFHLFSVKT